MMVVMVVVVTMVMVIVCLLLFYTIATVFQLYHGGDKDGMG